MNHELIPDQTRSQRHLDASVEHPLHRIYESRNPYTNESRTHYIDESRTHTLSNAIPTAS